MTATEFQKSPSGPTQCEIILRLLTEAKGEWVSMPDLMRAAGSGAVHSRIADLRLRGHDIEWRFDRDGRRILSWYRLLLPEEPTASDL